MHSIFKKQRSKKFQVSENNGTNGNSGSNNNKKDKEKKI